MASVGPIRGKLYPVYIYDPATKKTVAVKGHHARRRDRKAALKLGVELEDKAARDADVGAVPTVAEFERDWLELFPRSPQTNIHNKERMRVFVEKYGDRRMDEFAPLRRELRRFTADHPSVSAVARSMFSDAAKDHPTIVNPFLGLGWGRERRGG